jgi:hypothetical protein
LRQTSGPRWAGFPNSQRLWAEKNYLGQPWSYYGYTSATGSFFDSYEKLLELTLVISEFGRDIEQPSNLEELKKLSHELEKLQCQLQAASREFEKYSQGIKKLWASVQSKIDQLSARDK